MTRSITLLGAFLFFALLFTLPLGHDAVKSGQEATKQSFRNSGSTTTAAEGAAATAATAVLHAATAEQLAERGQEWINLGINDATRNESEYTSWRRGKASRCGRHNNPIIDEQQRFGNLAELVHAQNTKFGHAPARIVAAAKAFLKEVAAQPQCAINPRTWEAALKQLFPKLPW